MDICVLPYRLSHYFQDDVACRWTQSNWYSNTTCIIFLSRPDGLIPAMLSNVNKRNRSRNWWGCLRLWKIEIHWANALCWSVERRKGMCLTKENRGTLQRVFPEFNAQKKPWARCCSQALSDRQMWEWLIAPESTSTLATSLFPPLSVFCQKFFFFLVVVCLFWPHFTACRILVPQPGFEPGPSAMETWSPNHWIAREFPWQFWNGKSPRQAAFGHLTEREGTVRPDHGVGDYRGRTGSKFGIERKIF